MAEIVKKTSSKPKAPAKPRKTVAGKKSENGAANHVTEIRYSHDQVAMLAHRFFIERGHQHGHHLEDWFRAEQELRARVS
jgi:hypothetical protein